MFFFFERLCVSEGTCELGFFFTKEIEKREQKERVMGGPGVEKGMVV